MVDFARKLKSIQKRIRKNERAIVRLKKAKIVLSNEEIPFFEGILSTFERRNYIDEDLQSLIGRRPGPGPYSDSEIDMWKEKYAGVNLVVGLNKIIRDEELHFDIILLQEDDHSSDQGWSYEYYEIPRFSRIKNLDVDSFEYIYLQIARYLDDEVVEAMNLVQDSVDEKSEERVKKIISLHERNFQLIEEIKEIESKHDVVLGV